MRVIAGKQAVIGLWIVGTVVENADDRQGYFWMTRRMHRFITPTRNDGDICVPFTAIRELKRAGSWDESYHLNISKQEIGELPQRWQVQPRGTLTERLRQQGMGHGARPLSSPMVGMPVFADQPSGAAFPQSATPTGLHPIAQMGDQTLARIREAKRRHTERCQGAAPDEMEFLDTMLTDEIEAIKAEYDRARSQLRTEEAI